MGSGSDMVEVIGGGLAGCEAAYQLARRGFRVRLSEMRYTGGADRSPRTTPAHATGLLAELVCSNSLKSVETANAHGLLKAELECLDSLLLRAARESAVPAGKALAVDRGLFARAVTSSILEQRNIELAAAEVETIPDGPAIIASGPLTSQALAAAIQAGWERGTLFFYDAIAPIVSAESLDHGRLVAASRYQPGDGDYLNAMLDSDNYYKFIEALTSAQRHRANGFEDGHYFEGCLPVEVMADRSPDALRFGMMKPVGLKDPGTGRRPFAALQLRQEDRQGIMYNLVGCQTQLRQDEQRRVFRMVPGLERAEFLRYGSMHRNTYLDSPRLLAPTLEARDRPGLFFAGQLCGVEGYVESMATGLMAGCNCARLLAGRAPLVPPEETMVGALCRYVSQGPAAGEFQPMNANFGLLPELRPRARNRQERNLALARRSLEAIRSFAQELNS